MFKVGEVSIKAEKLIKITYESMMKAIDIIKDGIHLGDIGSTIQNHVEKNGFSVIVFSIPIPRKNTVHIFS